MRGASMEVRARAPLSYIGRQILQSLRPKQAEDSSGRGVTPETWDEKIKEMPMCED